MIVSFEGITCEHEKGWLYANISMPTLRDSRPHAVDCFNMESVREPTEMFLYFALKNWVKNNYASTYETE